MLILNKYADITISNLKYFLFEGVVFCFDYSVMNLDFKKLYCENIISFFPFFLKFMNNSSIKLLLVSQIKITKKTTIKKTYHADNN